MYKTSQQPEPVISANLKPGNSIKHGFFTRTGGVSDGIYAGLNVGIGSNDDPQKVATNRSRVASHFAQKPENLVTPYQIHSPEALVINGPFTGERPKADAVVTKTSGVIAGILTADCGPVLFADANAGVVGAAHAGWQGAVGGILESTIEKMEYLGAKKADIVAVLGPTISQKNYEVGPEFVERLLSLDSENSQWLLPSSKPGHAQFDLPGYIINRLNGIGIAASWTGHCTYEDEERFFSYRRTTHRAEPDYGRQISAICISE
jgi:YfiH family protein